MIPALLSSTSIGFVDWFAANFRTESKSIKSSSATSITADGVWLRI